MMSKIATLATKFHHQLTVFSSPFRLPTPSFSNSLPFRVDRHLKMIFSTWLCVLFALDLSEGSEKAGRLEYDVEYIFEPITIGKLTGLTSRECRRCSCGVNRRWTRIVGGWMTEVNEYPWMVALTKKKHFFCGGTLINDRYVTTAAHCVYKKRETTDWVVKDVQVILSEHNRVIKNETMNEVRRVSKAIIHPKFSPETLDSDIALLKLDRPVKFRQEIRPACLPPPRKIFDGEMATVTGWGATKEGGSPSIYLREAVVPILSNAQCTKKGYKPSRITENMLCAGDYRGTDSCQGDSGGPLLLSTSHGQMFTAGIVSWGEGCGRLNKPGVYTRVNQFLDWIVENTKDACYCY